MIVTGIVVEYNPLHNGHLKHIRKAREKTKCDILIAVMSGNFVQRGEPAIIEKYERVKSALLNEVDLIIEIPFVLVNQSASVFAEASVKLLDLAKCDYIVFGSEINDLESLKTFSKLNVNVDNLKEKMSDGTSYPKAYSILSQSFSPNDILGVAYLKALSKTNIEAVIIQRDNIGDLPISSASGIRKLVKENSDFKKYTPMINLEDNKVFMSDFFPIIKTKLSTARNDYLKTLGLFAEGIENSLIKQARSNYDYESFIDNCVSRRYTRARINRTLVFMLSDITQSELDSLPELNELKILGFNEVGQKYMRHLIDNEVKVVSKFKHLNKVYREFELKSTALYISMMNKDQQKKIYNRQFKGPIIYKDNKFYNDI